MGSCIVHNTVCYEYMDPNQNLMDLDLKPKILQRKETNTKIETRSDSGFGSVA